MAAGIIAGLCSGMALILVFCIGILFGKYILTKEEPEVKTPEPTEAEKRQLQKEQEAFITQMGYNVNTAYGIDQTMDDGNPHFAM